MSLPHHRLPPSFGMRQHIPKHRSDLPQGKQLRRWFLQPLTNLVQAVPGYLPMLIASKDKPVPGFSPLCNHRPHLVVVKMLLKAVQANRWKVGHSQHSVGRPSHRLPKPQVVCPP